VQLRHRSNSTDRAAHALSELGSVPALAQPIEASFAKPDLNAPTSVSISSVYDDHPVSGRPVSSCIFCALMGAYSFLQWPLHVLVMTKLGGASSKPSATTSKVASRSQVSHLIVFLFGTMTSSVARGGRGRHIADLAQAG
jgi:hypothetical protein